MEHTTEKFIDTFGNILIVHNKGECALSNCVIHNPSKHPLSWAPLLWRYDKGIFERICEHGVGHPDHDNIQFLLYIDEKEAEVKSVHGCDGCCA